MPRHWVGLLLLLVSQIRAGWALDYVHASERAVSSRLRPDRRLVDDVEEHVGGATSESDPIPDSGAASRRLLFSSWLQHRRRRQTAFPTAFPTAVKAVGRRVTLGLLQVSTPPPAQPL